MEGGGGIIALRNACNSTALPRLFPPPLPIFISPLTPRHDDDGDVMPARSRYICFFALGKTPIFRLSVTYFNFFFSYEDFRVPGRRRPGQFRRRDPWLHHLFPLGLLCGRRRGILLLLLRGRVLGGGERGRRRLLRLRGQHRLRERLQPQQRPPQPGTPQEEGHQAGQVRHRAAAGVRRGEREETE